MPNRIRVRLLLSYLFLAINLILLAGVTFYYFKRAEALRNAQSKILEADLKLQKLIVTDLLIINRETLRNDFFKSGRSPLLTEHQGLIDEIKNRIYQIKELEHGSIGEDGLLQIDTALIHYNENFNQYLHIVFVRGFRDFGLEGKMRDKAHLLEEMNSISTEELLYLRRHEKDFFLRKDTTYVEKFNTLCNELIDKNKHNTHFTHEQELLESYCALFNEIAKIDKELGFSENDGFRRKLHQDVMFLESRFNDLLVFSRDATEKKLDQAGLLFYISMGISFSLSIVLSLYFSNQIAGPVKKLASTMDEFVLESQDFTQLPSKLSYDTDEIQVLWQSFYQMGMAIKKQFEEINEKSELLERQNDTLNKLNKELDQFIYSASHDLKAPLASLLGLIHLLKLRVEPLIHDEYFDLMEGSVKRLENHIMDIIKYSKNHQLAISVQEIRLRNTIELILNQLRFQKGTEKIELELDVKEKITFYSDPMRLNMILFNLISNAFKYYDSTKQQQKIFISATVNAKNVVIKIEDNGLGIDKHYLDRIFDLFFRANEKSTGSGLGLFIAKEASDKLGGTIEVASELKIGTTFTIHLPNLYKEMAL